MSQDTPKPSVGRQRRSTQGYIRRTQAFEVPKEVLEAEIPSSPIVIPVGGEVETQPFPLGVPKPKELPAAVAIQKPIIPIFSPDPGEALDLFPVSHVNAQQRLVSVGQPITVAFVIFKGTATESMPDGNGALEVVRELGSGNLVNAGLFAPNPQLIKSAVEVMAQTDLIVYRITPDDLEALDIPIGERRTAAVRNRERFLRAALAREADPIHSGRTQLRTELLVAQAQAVELDSILKSDLTKRLVRLKEQQIGPLRKKIAALRQQIVEDERWLKIFFGLNIPWLIKDRAADTESVRRELETLRTIIEDLGDDNETLYKERDVLYSDLRKALEKALERGGSKLTLIDLLGRLDAMFNKRLKRPYKKLF